MSKRVNALREYLRMNPVILFCAAVAVLSAACTFGGDVEAWRKKAEAENIRASNKAVLTEVQAVMENGEDTVDAELGKPISGAFWAVLSAEDGRDDLGDEIGRLDFDGLGLATVKVTFAVQASAKATVTCAVATGSALPAEDDFKALTVLTDSLTVNLRRILRL